MRLVFTPEDGDAREQAQDELLNRFVTWARRQERSIQPLAVQVALDVKGEHDGMLGRWTASMLTDVLVDWFPRKVTLPEADLPDIPPTLHAWIDFLHDTRLLDAKSDPTDALHAGIDAAVDEYRAGMADPSRYDLGKFWTMTMLDHGVDLDDEKQRDAFVADLQAGEINVDMAIPRQIAERTTDQALDGQPTPQLPPVRLADTATLTDAAGTAPMIERMRGLVDWLGDGRKLTATGQLTLADARTVVETLHTGDTINPVIGDSTFRTKSSSELYGVRLLLAWARATRVVRVVKGRLLPVKSATKVLRDPLTLWERALEAFGKLRDPICVGGYGPSLVAAEFDDVTTTLLAALYTADGSVPRTALAEMIWDTIGDMYLLGETEHERELTRSSLRGDLRHLLDALEELGAVRQADATDPELVEQLTEADPNASLIGPDVTLVELTELGRWGANRRMRALGWHAPLVEDLADETAEVLIAALTELDEALADEAVDAWLAVRPGERAEAELAELAERTDDETHRTLARAAQHRAAHT